MKAGFFAPASNRQTSRMPVSVRATSAQRGALRPAAPLLRNPSFESFAFYGACAPCPKRAICASAGVRANPEIRRDPASCANRHVSVQSARLRPRTRARMASLVAFGCQLRTYGLVPADGSQSSLRPRVHSRRDTSSRDTASSSRAGLAANPPNRVRPAHSARHAPPRIRASPQSGILKTPCGAYAP